jgi:hypothetical protein
VAVLSLFYDFLPVLSLRESEKEKESILFPHIGGREELSIPTSLIERKGGGGSNTKFAWEEV